MAEKNFDGDTFAHSQTNSSQCRWNCTVGSVLGFVLWCVVMRCDVMCYSMTDSIHLLEYFTYSHRENPMDCSMQSNECMNEWQQIEVNNHSRIEDLHSVIWWLNRVWRLFRAQAYHSIELPQLFKWLSTISIAAQNMLAYFVGVDLTTLCLVSCAPLILHICRNVIGVV